MASRKQLIEELRTARDRRRHSHYVTLGTNVETARAVKVDVSQLSTYIIGMPGMGKSNLMAQLFLENQEQSKILIDPLGKLTNEEILPNIKDPSRVLYFSPAEQMERPLGFNPFDIGSGLDRNERDALAGSLRSIFTHLWLDSSRNFAVMSMVIQNSLNLLVQFDAMTFLDMQRLLLDRNFRKRLVQHIEDEPDLQDFWLKHYREDMGTSTFNKLNEFIQIRAVRRVVCQRRSSFSLEEAMKDGKIIIVNLGGLQENAKSLLGALFVSRVLAELSRRERAHSESLTPFSLFVDEFDMFGSQAFEEIISKCRQQKASVCIAHQHWGQIGTRMQRSVQQCAYQVCFQVDPSTAQGMGAIYGSHVDLSKVPRHHAWVRTQRMKTGSQPEAALIKTKRVARGNIEQVPIIKNQMWSLGRSPEEIDAEIGRDFDILVNQELVHEQQKENSKSIRTERNESATRTLSDWPPRFRNRPSVVSVGLGQ